ncbi:hypothetical protein NCC49_005742 [Naganishia albida]|nr:hypothetical protein NCC49_005742 [Naganishia albida]
MIGDSTWEILITAEQIDANYQTLINAVGNGTYDRRGAIMLTHESNDFTMSQAMKWYSSLKQAFANIAPINDTEEPSTASVASASTSTSARISPRTSTSSPCSTATSSTGTAGTAGLPPQTPTSRGGVTTSRSSETPTAALTSGAGTIHVPMTRVAILLGLLASHTCL